MLIHTVTYAKLLDADRWGTESLTNQQVIKNVRIEPSSKVIRDKNNAEVQLAAVLFYDCRNSSPRGYGLKEISQDILRDNASSNSENSNPEPNAKGGPAEWAFDEMDHWWHSNFETGRPSSTNRINIQTGFGGETKRIKKLMYTPRTDDKGGIIKDYEIRISTEATPTESQWETVKSGIFRNIISSQEVVLETAVEAKWIRLVATSNHPKDKFGNFATAKKIQIFEEAEVRAPGVVFKTDDIIIFNGERFKIQTCETLYDDKRLHHWELGLIRCG